jgi:choline dehydrogenase-like flavoprotein
VESKYNVVIVGAGVSGSLLAFRLSELCPGLSILVLEAGADRQSERTEMALAYAGSLIKSPRSPYDKNPATYLYSPDSVTDYQYEPGSNNFKSTYLKQGGGTTWHWLGHVPRFVPNDFKLLDNYQVGANWPIGYDELESFYTLAEKEMGVSGDHEEWDDLFNAKRSGPFPMPAIWPCYGDSVIKNNLDGKTYESFKIELRKTPQARNSHPYEDRPACAGNSSCVPICPIGAKYDATVHIRKALKNNVHFSYHSVVYNIEKGADEKISKLHFRNWDKEQFSVTADVFVIANHAIESAVLLQVSNIANSSGLVGKNLMDHPQGVGIGICNEPLFPFRGPPSTSGIDVFRDGDFRKKRAAMRMSVGNDAWGRWNNMDTMDAILAQNQTDANFLIGKDLRRSINQTSIRAFRFSYSTELLPDESNWVKPGDVIDPVTGLPRPKINFQISEYNKQTFEFAWGVMAFMFKEIGVSHFEVPTNRDDFAGAGHIMGTTKMGDDPKSAVVNKDCQCFDHPNLFIIGPGLFPTSGTANPTLTVAALTLRLAQYLADKFDQKH